METMFPHERLDAWKLAVAARCATWKLLDAVPRGYGEDLGQLRRSSQSAPKLIAEGANRWSPGEKRRRFDDALTEIGETASGLRELAAMGVVDGAGVAAACRLWGRCRGAVLGLYRRLE